MPDGYIPKMTEERAAQIALMIVKKKMKREGFNDMLMRDLGNKAKEVGITTEEARAFIEYLLPEMLEDILGRNISVVYGHMKK